MPNGIGQACRLFNFLVCINYYTTNTIRLCHESYFNVNKKFPSKSFEVIDTSKVIGWLISFSHFRRLVLLQFSGSCAEGCNKTQMRTCFILLLLQLCGPLNCHWRGVGEGQAYCVAQLFIASSITVVICVALSRTYGWCMSGIQARSQAVASLFMLSHWLGLKTAS